MNKKYFILSVLIFYSIFESIDSKHINGSELDDLKNEFINLKLIQDNFEMNLSQLNDELIKIKNQNSNNGSNSCGNDWISYLDIKCYKVLEKKGTEFEAKGNCSQLSDSSLITIQSKEEQLFLSSILDKYNNISDNVWIGLEMSEKSYKWLDGNQLKYENWDENSDKKEKCVEMSLGKSSLGKWRDDSCYKKYLIVCQKKQNTITVFQEELKNLTKVIGRQEKVINTQKSDLAQELSKQQKVYEYRFSKQQNQINSLIPIGFLYTQLPKQTSPQKLWPNMMWSEVTKEYSGLFFRAEGEESLPFGQTQQANQSWISDAYFRSCWFDSWSNYSAHCDVKSTSLNIKKWKNVALNGDMRVVSYLELYTTVGELRPKNTAIRIFKRIQ